jgi:hypothetical protein
MRQHHREAYGSFELPFGQQIRLQCSLSEQTGKPMAVGAAPRTSEEKEYVAGLEKGLAIIEAFGS